MPPNGVSIPAVLLSIIAVAVLLVIVLGLIDRERKRRQLFDQLEPAEIAKSFPQTVDFPANTQPPQIAPESAHQVVRGAYVDWLAKLILPDHEAGQAFVRMGVVKQNLRFQVVSTSFGQALGMFFSIVMAGDDLLAHQRFERLLAFCLSHPAADQAALTSWQSMPDVRTSARQDADPHAEGWILIALLAAQQQWSTSDRFNLSIIIKDRMAALRSVYEAHQKGDSQPCLISSPAFLTVLEQATNDSAWQTLSRSLTSQAHELLPKPVIDFTSSDSIEESHQALQLLNFGLDALWFGQQAQKDLSGKLLQLARERVESFNVNAQPDHSLESQGIFGSLAQLACCTPAVMAYGDQALTNQLWNKLTSLETSKFDPIGTSLRLLALMLLAKVAWPLSNNWQPDPVEA